MEVKKIIYVKFSDEEKEILNKALKFIDEFGKSDACQQIDCRDCPFAILCNYNSAEVIERKINNLLCE